eukprot:5955455-Pyramimonas_sp.AAC.3
MARSVVLAALVVVLTATSCAAGDVDRKALRPQIVTQTTHIPRVIHQTARTRPTGQVGEWVEGWAKKNPEWEHKFYDDAAVNAFMRERAPEYLEAFRAMTLPVVSTGGL